MEKTFEELVEQSMNWDFDFLTVDTKEGILQLMQQVREATGNEFLKAMEGVDLPIVTTMKIMAIMATTDRIKLTDENRKSN